MRLIGIESETGNKIVTNDMIAEMIYQENGENVLSSQIINGLDRMFNACGLKERRYLDENDKPINMVTRCAEKLIKEHNIDPLEIGMLIHCGVGRGFSEPNQAYFISKKLGINCDSFDVIEACNSWLRAVEISVNFMRAGYSKKIIIVNTECNVTGGDYVYPACFNYKDISELSFKFAGLTFGEAVTATILEPDNTNTENWLFSKIVDTSQADYCHMPNKKFNLYSDDSDLLATNGIDGFVTHSRLLVSEENKNRGIKSLLNLGSLKDYKYIFPHPVVSSDLQYEKLGHFGATREQIWNKFEMIGNTVSAGIPLSISDAIKSKKLERGDQAACLMFSAGSIFNSLRWTY